MLSIIAAVQAKDRAIGRDNRLLWFLYSDLRRFRQLTMGATVVMGRKTFESIGHPLDGRLTFVVSSRLPANQPGVCVFRSFEPALMAAERTGRRTFVIGGASLYEKALPLAQRLYLTLVASDVRGDVFFPPWEGIFTREVSRETRADEDTGLGCVFLVLDRP